MAQKINQDTHGNVCVLSGHEFGPIVADPFLLLSDVVMPGGVHGRQLADQAKRRRPNLKVLL
jgi:hypothetical protein